MTKPKYVRVVSTGLLLVLSTLQTPIASGAGKQPQQVLITPQDCSAEKLGTVIPVELIGEPVAAVQLNAPAWNAPTATVPAHCTVSGNIQPVDTSPSAQPIKFAVALPAAWRGIAIQMGGGGMNGVIPRLTSNAANPRGGTSQLSDGVTTYGSDSGHSTGDPAWALNEEAIRNLAYMQMKKTHDAAMVIMQRLYGMKPTYNYYVGTSQGGREALTVAQRYPADYDGITAAVPIVNFSSLMLAPVWIRIQEKPLANWVTPAKTNAIRAEFMRQCDRLDNRVDGVINNYQRCRSIFDVAQGARHRDPWAARRCPNNVDPNPADTSAAACLTAGQIETLQLVYTRYRFATPLANDTQSFGMWLPNTDPAGSGLIAGTRFRGQEGAADDAATHTHLGALGVTGFLMQKLQANPLDYVEGGSLNARRVQLSQWLDATNPDLSAFRRRGGKLLVVIGTNDTLASPGAQLDYYQSLLNKMGRATVDRFARLYVLPQTGHGLTGSSYSSDGDGKTNAVSEIPASFDRLQLLRDWVENGRAPQRSELVKAGNGDSRPLCSYPEYPRYRRGDPKVATSYRCTY